MGELHSDYKYSDSFTHTIVIAALRYSSCDGKYFIELLRVICIISTFLCGLSRLKSAYAAFKKKYYIRLKTAVASGRRKLDNTHRA